ncbi:MAG: family 43 glycosylhydrolase [Cyclobacteriaceae bacterium]
MKKISLLLSLVLLASLGKAQNPISPPGIYIADPSARVWKDGKLYIYGSADESVDYWCSHTHHALSTDDMLNWTLHKDYYQSKGPEDKVPYTDNVLYAPDAIYKDGKYYLYYCISHPTKPEGVAISDHPIKGFSKGQAIDLHGYEQIDPAAFVDDDGTAYYLWGQFTLKMAKLNDDMLSIDPTTIKDSVLTESRDYFHEGSYLTKRNGIYYMVYAHLDKAHRPTQIGYATSTSPMGPYKYGGVIIDNEHSDPEVWNNHGSMIEYKDQWYIFYHRSTHGTVRMRKACVEPIFFNEDGSIDEVEMTTQGAGPPLNPKNIIDAERACTLHGKVRIVAEGKSNEILTGIKPQDRAVYKYLQFSGTEKTLKIRAKGKGSGGKIHVTLDSPWNPPISTVEVPAGSDWKVASAKIQSTTGKHAVWLIFDAKEGNGLSVDWYQFE